MHIAVGTGAFCVQGAHKSQGPLEAARTNDRNLIGFIMQVRGPARQLTCRCFRRSQLSTEHLAPDERMPRPESEAARLSHQPCRLQPAKTGPPETSQWLMRRMSLHGARDSGDSKVEGCTGTRGHCKGHKARLPQGCQCRPGRSARVEGSEGNGTMGTAGAWHRGTTAWRVGRVWRVWRAWRAWRVSHIRLHNK